jgi:hypothetical protein
MRPKNRKWVVLAFGLYVLLMWSAYRWSIGQRYPEGSLYDHREAERKKKFVEQKAKDDAFAARTRPTGEVRLAAAGPAFFAAKYDATHVVFIAAGDTESRFAVSPVSRGNPTKIDAPAKPAAPLAGLQELWEPDSHSLHFFPEIIQKTPPGDRWTLSLSPDVTITVVIDRPVVAPNGCALALGLLASIPPDQQAAFAASRREYFVIRHKPVESADPPSTARVAELPDWKPSPAMRKLITQQLNDRMKKELAQIDARLVANAASPGEAAGELPVGGARPRLKEWLHADQGLTRGEGALDFDLRAFRLTPDGDPRLYVRARWCLADATVFLMSAWFRVPTQASSSLPDQPPPAPPQPATTQSTEPQSANQPVLLSADSTWSAAMRESEGPDSSGDQLNFQSILNEFDADHDGWAELLIHSDDVHSYQGAATTISLYLYTDLGLVPLKTPYHHEIQSPQSCLDP